MNIKILTIIILILSILGCESRTKRVNNKSENIADTTPPVLTLKGKNLDSIYVGQNYIDSGFSAYDDTDGDITGSVKKSGVIDNTKIGRYKIKYSVKDSAGNEVTKSREVRVTTYATLKLKNLENAKVDIFKFSQNSLNLKWSEDIKNRIFDTHSDELEDNTTYLYQIKGGTYTDNNGTTLTNSGSINIFIKKSYLQSLGNSITINTLSELSYELSKVAIRYNYSQENLFNKLDEIAKELIKSDINGDSNIDYLDILTLDKEKDINSLSVAIKDKLDTLKELIYNNKGLLLNLNSKINSIATNAFARSITKSQDNTKLYIANGDGGISIVDIANHRVLDNISTNGFVRKIALNQDESIAYVANSEKGFSIVDLNSKEVVANIPTYDTNSTKDCDARDVVIKDNIAYLAASSRGIMLIDISNSANPKLLKVIDTPDIAYAIKLLDDNTALVADGKTGVLAIDLESNATISKFNTYGSANSLTLSSDKSTLYIADGKKGVVLVDINDISNPTYKNHISTTDFASYVTLNADETIAYISDRKGNIEVVDLREDRLSISEHLVTNYRSYSAVLSSNENYLYVASGTSGVTILSTKIIKNPAKLAKISTRYKAYNSTIKNDIIYIAQGFKGLLLFDIKDAFNPKFKGYLDTQGMSIDVITDSNFTYLADGYKGLLKLDTNNPKNITKIDSIDTDGFASSIKFIPNSNNIILSDGSEGVKIIDKDSFTVINSIKTDNKVLDVTVSQDGKMAYLALGNGGVLIINLSDFTQISTIQTQDYAKRVILSGDGSLAYVVGENSIKVVDTNSQKIVNSIATNSFSSDIKVLNNIAYVATQNGLELINLDTKESLGLLDCGDEVRDITIQNSIAYLSSSNMGICIVDLDLLVY